RHRLAEPVEEVQDGFAARREVHLGVHIDIHPKIVGQGTIGIHRRFLSSESVPPHPRPLSPWGEGRKEADPSPPRGEGSMTSPAPGGGGERGGGGGAPGAGPARAGQTQRPPRPAGAPPGLSSYRTRLPSFIVRVFTNGCKPRAAISGGVRPGVPFPTLEKLPYSIPAANERGAGKKCDIRSGPPKTDEAPERASRFLAPLPRGRGVKKRGAFWGFAGITGEVCRHGRQAVRASFTLTGTVRVVC